AAEDPAAQGEKVLFLRLRGGQAQRRRRRRPSGVELLAEASQEGGSGWASPIRAVLCCRQVLGELGGHGALFRRQGCERAPGGLDQQDGQEAGQGVRHSAALRGGRSTAAAAGGVRSPGAGGRGRPAGSFG